MTGMKRWFNEGDIAHMNKNRRGDGFNLKINQPVKILKWVKIDQKAGAYMYTIEVENPKTKEPVILEEWVTQLHLIHPDFWKESQAMKKEIERLEKELAEKGVEY